jgi:ribonuclease P protein component
LPIKNRDARHPIILKIDANTPKSFLGSPAIKSQHLVVKYMPNNLGHARIAIQITKKASKLAVIRNNIRRIIREDFKKNLSTYAPFDILILITNKIHSEKPKISDILMQEWKQSSKLLPKPSSC